MQKIPFLFFLFFLFLHAQSQVFFTKNGNVSFYSKSLLQDIEADNNQVISVLNLSNGSLQFSLLNEGFHFPKAKMEEDFNENYMESDKYPRSSFQGFITNFSSVEINKDGTYPVEVKGDLSIHGVTKNIVANGTLVISKKTISAHSYFNVLVKDYGIKIPSIVSNKIAEQIQVKVNCTYQPK